MNESSISGPNTGTVEPMHYRLGSEGVSTTRDIRLTLGLPSAAFVSLLTTPIDIDRHRVGLDVDARDEFLKN